MKVGEELLIIIPKLVPEAKVFTEHTVAIGETFWSISRQYGVSVKQLKDWNNRKDDILSPGEKLKVRSSK